MRSIHKLFMLMCLCIAALYVHIGFCEGIAVSEDSLFYEYPEEAEDGKKVTIYNISDKPVILDSIEFTCYYPGEYWWDEDTELPYTLAAGDSLGILVGAYLPTRYSPRTIWHDTCFIGYDGEIILIRLYLPSGVVSVIPGNNAKSSYTMKPVIVLADQSSAQARIHYTLMSPGAVRVIIFNTNGKEVRTLVDNFSQAGSYEVIWDYKNSVDRLQSSGMHYATFTAETRAGVTQESVKLPFVK